MLSVPATFSFGVLLPFLLDKRFTKKKHFDNSALYRTISEIVSILATAFSFLINYPLKWHFKGIQEIIQLLVMVFILHLNWI
jgi:hypothetical protein